MVASGQGDVACGFIGQDKGQAASNCVKKMLVEAGPIGPTRINCRLIGESTFRVSESSLFQDPTLRKRAIDRVLLGGLDCHQAELCRFWKGEDEEAKQVHPSSSCELRPPLQF